MGKRILVVDDEQDVLDIIKDRLESSGYEVKTFTDGQQCVDFLNEDSADLILLDIEMPVMNGIDTLAIVHNHYPDIPVIILSATTTKTKARATLERGAVDYILKPFDARELMEKVRKYIRDNKKDLSGD